MEIKLSNSRLEPEHLGSNQVCLDLNTLCLCYHTAPSPIVSGLYCLTPKLNSSSRLSTRYVFNLVNYTCGPDHHQVCSI